MTFPYTRNKKLEVVKDTPPTWMMGSPPDLSQSIKDVTTL